MDRHLGTAKELSWFAMEMAEQLEIHRKEKTPLREADLDNVIDIVTNQIRVRNGKIDSLATLDESLERNKAIEKQCVHIANYAMMLFLRSKYNV